MKEETSEARAERLLEIKNESKYRSLFTDVLSKNSGFMRALQGGSTDNIDMSTYSAEQTVLRNVLSVETNSVVAGVVTGIAGFFAFRHSPTLLVRRFGGAQKLAALREAEAAEAKDPNRFARRGVGLCIELIFGVWAGSTMYRFVSNHNSPSTYKDIAKLPLIEGRSLVAEHICDDWVRVAQTQVPEIFWENLKHEDSLSDPQLFSAFAAFAVNCRKRKEYEDQVRREQGLSPEDPIVIPSPGLAEMPQDGNRVI